MQRTLKTASAQAYDKGQEQQNTAALKQLEFIGMHCVFSFSEIKSRDVASSDEVIMCNRRVLIRE